MSDEIHPECKFYPDEDDDPSNHDPKCLWCLVLNERDQNKAEHEKINAKLRELEKRLPRKKMHRYSLEEINTVIEETVIGDLVEYETQHGVPAGWCMEHHFVFAAARGCLLCQQDRHKPLYATNFPGGNRIIVWRVAQLLRVSGSLGIPAMTLILNAEADEVLNALNGLLTVGLVRIDGDMWDWNGGPSDLSPVVEFLRVRTDPATTEQILDGTGMPSLLNDLDQLEDMGLVSGDHHPDREKEWLWTWTGDEVLEKDLEELEDDE